MDEPDGRRLYIHKQSFTFLAQQDFEIAKSLVEMLTAIRIAKAMHHHLSDQGVELNLVRQSVADALVRSYERSWKSIATGLFRRIGFTPVVPIDRRLFTPLLDQDESIVATCSEDNYYTFATGVAAADRMFADMNPINLTKQKIKAGNGPKDLTIIHGNAMTEVRSDLGFGLVAKSYRPYLKAAVELGDVETVENMTRQQYLEQLRRQLFEPEFEPTADETYAFNQLFAATSSAFAARRSL